MESLAAQLDACALAIVTGSKLDEDAVRPARETFETAVENVRQARLTAGMTFDAAARIWGLVFALESLLANIADLAGRIAEMSGAQPATAGTP